ncbi:hypothetical protein [Nocardia arthritidis]|uniref:Uncharacterized protein n=1 Tax=Nocardia arthritidis TaxID=228602 RepID=A0A6G9YKG3_9NOCA|nr:hypothetical protein [Nocardia arthritidis]QIS13678.1 hypothetical protein F5544_29165 [Nocardia arthritidis]
MEHGQQGTESVGAMLSSIAAALREFSDKLDEVAGRVDGDRGVEARLAKLEAWAFRAGQDISGIDSRLDRVESDGPGEAGPQPAADTGPFTRRGETVPTRGGNLFTPPVKAEQADARKSAPAPLEPQTTALESIPAVREPGAATRTNARQPFPNARDRIPAAAHAPRDAYPTGSAQRESGAATGETGAAHRDSTDSQPEPGLAPRESSAPQLGPGATRQPFPSLRESSARDTTVPREPISTGPEIFTVSESGAHRTAENSGGFPSVEMPSENTGFAAPKSYAETNGATTGFTGLSGAAAQSNSGESGTRESALSNPAQGSGLSGSGFSAATYQSKSEPVGYENGSTPKGLTYENTQPGLTTSYGAGSTNLTGNYDSQSQGSYENFVAPEQNGASLTGSHRAADEDRSHVDKLQAMLDELKKTAGMSIGRSDVFGPPAVDPTPTPLPTRDTSEPRRDYRLSGPPPRLEPPSA